MRAQLNRIAEIGAEFAKLGIQMGMPTGFNYFFKSEDWLNDMHVIYTGSKQKFKKKSTLADSASFAYKEISIRLTDRRIELPVTITDKQLEVLISELETKLEYLKSDEGILELKEVIENAWNKF